MVICQSRSLAVLTLLMMLVDGCSGGNSGEVIVLDAPSAKPAAAAAAIRASTPEAADQAISPRVLRRFSALKPGADQPVALVELGRSLYYDQRLSSTGMVSCNSCHPLDNYGVTDTPVSTGVNGQRGSRNAPSTYHAAQHFVQFWDGRAPTIDLQALGPLQNLKEMGMSPIAIVTTLQGISGYAALFSRAFPGDKNPITLAHVGNAIGAFEHGLSTPSRWDRYLLGDVSALTAKEVEGAKVFANIGCIVCHTGPYIGGSMFEKLGARAPWPKGPDHGRSAVTGLSADEMVFKVPSLRNVARTAPYFHDGSVTKLDDAVRKMAHYQLGVDLEEDEVAAIVSWLGALTGEIPQAYIAKPVLP